MLGADKPVSLIAQELTLSTKTVSTYRQRSAQAWFEEQFRTYSLCNRAWLGIARPWHTLELAQVLSAGAKFGLDSMNFIKGSKAWLHFWPKRSFTWASL